MGRCLSIPELAQETGLTERWWKRAIFERRVPVVKFGHLVRVREEDLTHFVEANVRPARDGEAVGSG